MKRFVSLLLIVAALLACGTQRGAAKREAEVFVVAFRVLEFPPSMPVDAADETEAYDPWLSGPQAMGGRPSFIEKTIWSELRSRYAAANRVSVAIPRGLVTGRDVHSASPPLILAFSRPGFSSDGSFALLTYSTAWQGHGTVGAIVLRRTQNGWQHLGTIPLVAA